MHTRLWVLWYINIASGIGLVGLCEENKKLRNLEQEDTNEISVIHEYIMDNLKQQLKNTQTIRILS